MTAFSAASESGSCAAMAASARAGTRLTGASGARAIISPTRRPASRTSPGIAAVSGMLCQYFFGISARIAARLVRAGLKVLE